MRIALALPVLLAGCLHAAPPLPQPCTARPSSALASVPLASEGPPVPRTQGGKVGYRRRDGSWAIPPTFDDGEAFVAGRAWVREGGAWLQIDASGTVLLRVPDAAYTPGDVRTSRGLVHIASDAGEVLTTNLVCGLSTGEVLFDLPRTVQPGTPSGHARETIWGPDGHRIFTGYKVAACVDGLLLAAAAPADDQVFAVIGDDPALSVGSGWALYDLRGEIVRAFPDLVGVRDQTAGTVPVAGSEVRDLFSIFVTSDIEIYLADEVAAGRALPGGWLVPGVWTLVRGHGPEDSCCLGDGLYAHREPGTGLWGYRSVADGRPVLAAAYQDTGAFSSGVAAVRAPGEATWHLIDRTGAAAGSGSWEYVGRFSEGLAVAGAPHRWGVTDQRGCWVVPPRYEEIQDLQDGRYWTVGIPATPGPQVWIGRAGEVQVDE